MNALALCRYGATCLFSAMSASTFTACVTSSVSSMYALVMSTTMSTTTWRSSGFIATTASSSSVLSIRWCSSFITPRLTVRFSLCFSITSTVFWYTSISIRFSTHSESSAAHASTVRHGVTISALSTNLVITSSTSGGSSCSASTLDHSLSAKQSASRFTPASITSRSSPRFWNGGVMLFTWSESVTSMMCALSRSASTTHSMRNTFRHTSRLSENTSSACSAMPMPSLSQNTLTISSWSVRAASAWLAWITVFSFTCIWIEPTSSTITSDCLIFQRWLSCCEK